MKRIEITSNVLVPSDIEGQMKSLFVGTVVDVDDTTAGLVVAAGRAVYVKKDDAGKFDKAPVDTTPTDAPADKAEKPAK